MYKGIGASEGVAYGKAFLVKKEEIVFETASKLSADGEVERFNKAIEKFIIETSALIENMRINAGEAEAGILEGHMIMAQDPEIIDGVINALKGDSITAEAAVTSVLDMFAELFASMDDEIMSQRGADLKDIKTRLIEILTGANSAGVEDIKENCIIVCHDLAPSETGKMDKSKVLGIVTEIGGMTSHTAIISRAMEIPTVLSVKDALSIIKDGDIIAINGKTGELVINPSSEEIEKYNKLMEDVKARKKELEAYKEKESVTLDGHHVEICANIGGPSDLESVIKNTAEGVGLFRTEFLFMDRTSLPTEEDQFNVYKQVAEKMNGKPVIIRTLDIGGDKDVPYLNMEKEENPFLGYRAIRLCLGDKAMFSVQLRALLRASNFGNIKIMLPMITTMTELRDGKALIEEIKKDLDKENIPYNKNIEVGIMIETPASYVIADMLAKESAFFSIGTNDLTQYTMAVDRGNEKVQYLYSTFDPAVIRSIYTVIKAAKAEGIMVGMCGEGAGDVNMIPFLLAAGLDEFSMTASSILPARKSICSLNKKELEKELDVILNLSTRQEVFEYLEKFAVK